MIKPAEPSGQGYLLILERGRERNFDLFFQLIAALSPVVDLPYFAVYNAHLHFWPNLSGKKCFVLIF